ncbi:hypothetical protein L195_g014703 [Trifolium pratense]|uniref:Retrotransposon gag domain-containing protein n=1 Tax=Trifolium pratense TaxID=57577 RepID=A0A2K3PRQ0_TRIPR|nr:hypothetical protein L195_g014703 [Trifolium pratense]
MAGNNNQIPEQMAENNHHALYQPLDGQPASVIGESQCMSMDYEEYVPEDPQIQVAVPPPVTGTMVLPQGAPMQDIMAALVNAINRQSDMILQQNQKFEEHNVRLESQSRQIDAIAESRITTHSQNRRLRRSPTPERRARHSPRRATPPRHQRRRSPVGGESHQGPLSRRIRELPLLAGLENPPVMDTYDGSSDPDKHIENLEALLEYRNVRGSIKCKLFPTTMRKEAMAWYKSLPPGSIDSLPDLCARFKAHFTSSRHHPKTEATLEAII